MPVTAYSASDILVELLVQAGQLARITSGQPVNASLFAGYAGDEPDKPDNTVTIYDTDAGNNYRSFVDLKTGGPSGVQVRVRGTTHRIAYSKISEINDYLAQVVRRGVSIETEYYMVDGCSNIGNIIGLGRESPQSQRHLFTLNLYVEVTDRGS